MMIKSREDSPLARAQGMVADSSAWSVSGMATMSGQPDPQGGAIINEKIKMKNEKFYEEVLSDSLWS